MNLLTRIIFTLFSNAVALFAAAYFIEGFSIAPSAMSYLEISAVFALINFFIKPILKLILVPIVMLTFGAGIIIVNAISLYILDFALDSITISGLYPLVYATLVIGVVNFFLGFMSKSSQENK